MQHAVPQKQFSIKRIGKRFIVRDDDVADVQLFVEIRHQGLNTEGGIAIKIPGRLIQQDSGRLRNQRSRYCNTLTLSSGEL